MNTTEDLARDQGATEAEQPSAPLPEVEKLKGAINDIARKLLEVKFLVQASKAVVYTSASAVLAEGECEAGDEFNETLSLAYAKLTDTTGYVEECLQIIKDLGLDGRRSAVETGATQAQDVGRDGSE
jgi:hypothetical protein